MYYLLFLTTVLVCMLGARAENAFFRPAGAGPTEDYRDNPVYRLGEYLDMQLGNGLRQCKHSDIPTRSTWRELERCSTCFSYESVYPACKFPNRTTTLRLILYPGDATKGSFSWDISYDDFPSDHNASLSNVYFFLMNDAASGDILTTSHYFNVSDPASSTSTTTAPSSTSISSKATSTTSSVPVPTSSSEPTPTDQATLSTGAVAGIAVGATLGGLLVVGLIGFLVWKHRFKEVSTTEKDHSVQSDKITLSPAVRELHGVPRSELPIEPHSTQTPSELQ